MGFAANPGEFAEQVLLPFTQVSWHGDNNFDDLIPATVSLQSGDALALQDEGLAPLSSGGDFDLLRPGERGNLQLGAEGRLNKAYGDAAMDIVSPSFKKFMWFNREEEIKIAGRTAEFPFLPLAAYSQS